MQRVLATTCLRGLAILVCDKATGWSRWIKANKQRPATMSVFTEDYTPNEPKRKPKNVDYSFLTTD